MTERRFHDANSGRDSKQLVWIFEGNNVLWIMVAMGIAILLFRFFNDKMKWSIPESILVSLIPLVLATLYITILKQGKPKSYDKEMFEWFNILILKAMNDLGLGRGKAYFAPSPGLKDNPFKLDKRG